MMDLTESELRSIIKEQVLKIMRDKRSIAKNINEDVMYKFYNIDSNHLKPILVERITIDRIIKKHGQNGYIIISANRSNEDEERNVSKTKELYRQIYKSGFSFLPVYGGYRGTDGVEDDYEPSFIVFNYNKKGDAMDFNDLYKLGLKWCEEYGQNAFTVKAPGESPKHIDRNGNKINDYESLDYWKNDPNQAFFTSLTSKEKTDPKKPSRRFTLDIGYEDQKVSESYYINPAPCTLIERMRRGNEIFLF